MIQFLPFKDGEIIRLSAIGEYSYTDEWSNEDVEGIYLRLNDEVYRFAIDPNDGYRSYGTINKGFLTDENGDVIKTSYIEFPEQSLKFHETEVEDEDENGWHLEYWQISLFNVETNKEVLSIGTDTSDNYYPYAIYRWYPENLPINKNK